jgi:Tfp pilus assembly protein PilN
VNNRLNLASRPFTNRALPWVVTVVLVFFSLVALVFIVRSTVEANTKAEVVQKDINSLEQKQRALLKDAEAVKNTLTPQQLKTLKSAHELIDRKQFSWSRLFSDLEAVLPNGVRVGRIAVRQVHTEEGRTVADLELTVIAKSPIAVTDMIADMDQEGIFHAELRQQNLQKGKGADGAEYELVVQYRPRAGFASSAEPGPRAAVERSPADAKGGVR